MSLMHGSLSVCVCVCYMDLLVRLYGYVHAFAHLCMEVRGGYSGSCQSLSSSSLRQGLSLCWSVGLTRCFMDISSSSSPCNWGSGIQHLSRFFGGFWGQAHCGRHACTAGTLPTSPAPRFFILCLKPWSPRWAGPCFEFGVSCLYIN